MAAETGVAAARDLMGNRAAREAVPCRSCTVCEPRTTAGLAASTTSTRYWAGPVPEGTRLATSVSVSASAMWNGGTGGSSGMRGAVWAAAGVLLTYTADGLTDVSV